MPDITNPVAVAFADSRIRPTADRLSARYYEAKRLVDDWNALGMASLIPNTADVIVSSGSDARPPITGIKATAIVTRAQEIVTDYEAASKAKLNTVLAAAVNPGG